MRVNPSRRTTSITPASVVSWGTASTRISGTIALRASARVRRKIGAARAQAMQKARQCCGRYHGREVVAGENKGNQAIAPFEQPREPLRMFDSTLALRVHLEFVGGDDGDLARREEGLKNHAGDNNCEQGAYSHRLSLTNSTVAPLTFSTAASSFPSRNFSPARGTRPSRRNTKLPKVCGPLLDSKLPSPSASLSLSSSAVPETSHSPRPTRVTSGPSKSNSSRISPKSSSSKSSSVMRPRTRPYSSTTSAS